MTAAQDVSGDDMAAETARAKVADAGRKMARYRAAIDAGGDLEEISTWISDAKAQRLAAEAELRRATRSRMTRQQIADLISKVSDLAATLRGPSLRRPPRPTGSLACASPTARTSKLSAPQQRRSRTIKANGWCPRGECNHKPMRTNR
jgi:hypothetical protein